MPTSLTPPLTAEADLQGRLSTERLEALFQHLVAHGIVRQQRGAETLLLFPHFPGAEMGISARGDGLRIRISAPDQRAFDALRQAVGANLMQAAGDGIRLSWKGETEPLPGYRTLRLIGIADPVPGMRRLTFSGADVARYDRLDALHLKAFFPAPDPGQRPVMRKYTVRSVDVAAGRLVIDFVLHEAAGPGADFARKARIGDEIGVIGPGGGGLIEADWYLFAGDETALPAIARMLAALPAGGRGEVILSAPEALIRADLSLPPGLRLTRLDPATPDPLPAAIRQVGFPAAGSCRRYVWVGCEYAAFRAIRHDLRRTRGLAAAEHLVVSYWRRDMAQS